MRQPDSLAVVLAVRLRAEEIEERALAHACAQVHQAEAKLDALRVERKRVQSDCLGEAGTLLHGTDLQAREQRLSLLRNACNQAQEALEHKVSLRAVQQEAYLEARRGREVLDTLLKQRAHTEQRERQRRETSRAEDLFLSRRAHNGPLPTDAV